MEESGNNLRFCRKCLTGELAAQADIHRSIRAYIDNLDPEIKAERGLYERRLEICRECGLLLQGMCRSCGCYVEMRAAMAKNGCPEKSW